MTAIITTTRGHCYRRGVSFFLVALLFSSGLIRENGRLLPLADAQECTSGGACDKHERCPVWEEEGECLLNHQYMKENCPASCKKTDHKRIKLARGECDNLHRRCSLWAESGECEENEIEMRRYCPKACGFCGAADDDGGDSSCTDTHENCDYWAKNGECENFAEYMGTCSSYIFLQFSLMLLLMLVVGSFTSKISTSNLKSQCSREERVT